MATATETKSLHLHRLEIENLLRVQALTVDADGHHVMISGRNASGKTSTVESIWAAIKGLSVKQYPEPVHRGAERGSVRVDLGEYIVERDFPGNRLTVKAADGSKITKPQALLDGFLGTYGLDPIAFLDRRPQDQVDDVLAICGVQPPAERVKKITGEAHQPLPGESADSYLGRLSADETGLYYVRRREANRVTTQKRDALQEQAAIVAKLGGPLKPNEKPASASSLLQEIAELQQVADQRRVAVQEAADAEKQRSDNAASIARLESQRANEATRVRLLEKQMEELKRQIEEASTGVAALDKRIADGREIVKADAEDAAKLKAVADSIPDPTTKISALRDRIAGLERDSKTLAERRMAAEQQDRLAQETERAQAEHKKLDDILAALRNERLHLLDGVDLGVSGLTVGDGELLYNQIPFRQASLAQRIRVACAVAMRQNPRLKLLRIDNCEHLDSESTRLVLELCDRNGWQCVMTRVSDAAELKVEIVDADPATPTESAKKNGLFTEPTMGPYGR
jgi:DNA repair exonuclease SbcCD ATPase subunit